MPLRCPRFLRPSSLQARLMLMVALLVCTQVAVSWTLLSGLVSDLLREQIGQRALQTAKTVAAMPAIHVAMEAEDTSGVVQAIAEGVRRKVGAQYVVVCDERGTRYSHPVPERIGKTFVGGDMGRVLERGEEYVSEAVGTLGRSIRGFAPIHDDGGTVIGFVSVGYLKENVGRIISENMGLPVLVVVTLLVIGLSGAMWIATRVKRMTLGLEPAEITALYLKREAILESIREGVVALDAQGEVVLTNKAALRHAGLSQDAGPRDLDPATLLPGLALEPVLDDGQALHDHDFTLDGRDFVASVTPVLHQGNIQGAVATFRPADELENLARELSRVQEYTELLRGQTHEYSNKLHTIGGLLQIGAHQDALEVVLRESSGYQDMIRFLQQAISPPVIAAIIMGKYARARELRIDFDVDRHGTLTDVPEWMNHEKIVTILGNLLDNAFESVLDRPEAERRAVLSFTDLGNELVFEVEDSGLGIPVEQTERIFQRGMSGKGAEHRGVGLHLVRRCAEDLGGQITVSDSELGGALFTVALPKTQPRHPASGRAGTQEKA